MLWLPLGLVLLLDVLSSFSHGALLNRTIDDTYGDSVTGVKPIYQPGSVWEASCKCVLTPDKDFAHNGTWTAATYKPGQGDIQVELSFTGVAIYVYFILPQGEAIANFILDNASPVPFRRGRVGGTVDFEYNALAFFRQNLTNTAHNLTFVTSGSQATWVSFDYANYTIDTGPDQSENKPPENSNKGHSVPIGAIAGGVAGGLIVIISIAGAFFLLRRRKLQREKMSQQPLVTEVFQSRVLPDLPTPTQTVHDSNPFMPTLTPDTSSTPVVSPKAELEARMRLRSLADGLSLPSGGSSRGSASTPLTSQNLRRQELTQQLNTVQRELAGLARSETIRESTPTAVHVATLAQQMRDQQALIEELQDQLNDLGFLPEDVPPPDYETNASVAG